MIILPKNYCFFYRTKVWSLSTPVSDSLTYWLTHCCFVDLTDVTLAFEDDKSKLFDVVSVADVVAEERVDSLIEILKLKHGRGLEPKFWSKCRCRRFWRWTWVKTLRLESGRGFEAGVWSKFWSLSLVEILSWILIKSSHFDEGTQPLGLLCLWQCLCYCSLSVDSRGKKNYFYIITMNIFSR